MNANRRALAGYGAILLVGGAAPFLFPNFMIQLTVLWIFILFALTWDTLGGQMGYNSLGNIVFFGAGMYISAIVQIGFVADWDVGSYTAHYGAIKVDLRRSSISPAWPLVSARRPSAA